MRIQTSVIKEIIEQETKDYLAENFFRYLYKMVRGYSKNKIRSIHNWLTGPRTYKVVQKMEEEVPGATEVIEKIIEGDEDILFDDKVRDILTFLDNVEDGTGESKQIAQRIRGLLKGIKAASKILNVTIKKQNFKEVIRNLRDKVIEFEKKQDRDNYLRIINNFDDLVSQGRTRVEPGELTRGVPNPQEILDKVMSSAEAPGSISARTVLTPLLTFIYAVWGLQVGFRIDSGDDEIELTAGSLEGTDLSNIEDLLGGETPPPETPPPRRQKARSSKPKAQPQTVSYTPGPNESLEDFLYRAGYDKNLQGDDLMQAFLKDYKGIYGKTDFKQKRPLPPKRDLKEQDTGDTGLQDTGEQEDDFSVDDLSKTPEDIESSDDSELVDETGFTEDEKKRIQNFNPTRAVQRQTREGFKYFIDPEVNVGVGQNNKVYIIRSFGERKRPIEVGRSFQSYADIKTAQEPEQPQPAVEEPAPAPEPRQGLRRVTTTLDDVAKGKVMLPGQMGDGIKAMQTMIAGIFADMGREDILPKYGADGKYGRETRNAVTVLQRDVLGFTGKDIDGKYGPKTHAAFINKMADKKAEDEARVADRVADRAAETTIDLGKPGSPMALQRENIMLNRWKKIIKG